MSLADGHGKRRERMDNVELRELKEREIQGSDPPPRAGLERAARMGTFGK